MSVTAIRSWVVWRNRSFQTVPQEDWSAAAQNDIHGLRFSFLYWIKPIYAGSPRSAAPTTESADSRSSLMNLSAANAAIVPSAMAVVRYR